MKKILLAVFTFICLLFSAQQALAAEKTTVYFFWGEGCPHCATEKPFLEEMEQKYPQLEVKSYETWKNKDNMELFEQVAQAYGIQARGVPTTFIGDNEPIIGFAEYMADDMESKIISCLEEGCVDPGVKAGLVAAEEGQTNEEEAESEPAVEADPTIAPTITSAVTSEPTNPATDINSKADIKSEIDPKNEKPLTPLEQKSNGSNGSNSQKSHKIKLPLLGEVDLAHMPLFLMTSLIAFVDGFNPCSLWVITFLLGIVLHTGSRKKVFAVGLTFITVATLVYGLFILGLFNALALIGYMKWIKLAVAAVALIFGLVNIKDYFWYKKGISFTIPDRFKPGIFKNTRELMKKESMLGLIFGTIVLAFGVTFIELICTAGFPVIWTTILSENNVSPILFASLFAIYMLIYFLDEAFVFGTIVLTLKASKFEEKQGRALKLLGGIIMLTLAYFWLTNPELMNEVVGMFKVFTIAFGITGVVYLLHKKILPVFGIEIGNESQDLTIEKEENQN